jgi:predicted MFS family arabinose efflux permease
VESLLVIFSAVAMIGIYFARSLPDEEVLGSKIPLANVHSDYDWQLIFRALLPTFMIAFGAGFTIPIINLFFYNVHHMNAETFSLVSMFAFILVTIGGFSVPEIKRRYGFKFSITFFQGLSIIALFVLGTTEWYNGWSGAVIVAIVAYIIRQPLMNIAAPMTSELTMKYVGEKNREIISALTAAIWSGSWFASAQIFAILREMNMSYSNIVFITVVFYIIGVSWYYWLIRDYERINGSV